MTRPYFCAAFLKPLAGRIVAEVVVKTDDGALVRRVAKTRAAGGLAGIRELAGRRATDPAVAALPASVDRARLPMGW